MKSYGEDLAYINDVGFSDFAIRTVPGVLGLLCGVIPPGGLVVELGCGSGRLAAAVQEAGYNVLGIDLSPEMIALARQHAPGAQFKQASLWTVEIPPCNAVFAVGEVFNYRFDQKSSRQELSDLFRRVHEALRPGGVFAFDVAGPDRVPDPVPALFWKEGKGWAISVAVNSDPERRSMTRNIVCFRQTETGDYRRSEEFHEMRLIDAAEAVTDLKSTGFRARERAGYGRLRLYQGMRVVVARKR